MDNFAWPDLAQHRGEEFRFDPGTGESLPLRLTDVTLSGDGGYGGMTATFEATEPQPFNQGAYVITHESLGPFELVAVPTGPAQLSVTVTWLDAPSPAP